MLGFASTALTDVSFILSLCLFCCCFAVRRGVSACAWQLFVRFPSRYDGEWVDDLPKCGAYTEMPPDELAPASQVPDPIPGIELQDPTGVLAERLGEIRAERAHYRAKRISLEEQFTPEELEALQLAFERTSTTGQLSYSQLFEAFSQVGMSPSEVELDDALAQFGRAADASFAFADFAQMAVR